ncbi:MAG TPA: SIS domain-containing protein [Tepidisphaeraceae bacterium]|nr:SIS domain-containing protein [Tepidisphaeraceae bacterium]
MMERRKCGVALPVLHAAITIRGLVSQNTPSTQPLSRAIDEWSQLLPKMAAFEPMLHRLGETLLACWAARGKVLTAGNGGSAADAIHLAEELVVRFHKPRRALAAIALCDAGNLTCAANDMGFDEVFARQVEALGNPGDVLVVFTTSGNSPNIMRAIETAKMAGLKTVAFIGKTGGKAKAHCDFEFLVPSQNTARVQEAHLMLYHSLCEWIDQRVGE